MSSTVRQLRLTRRHHRPRRRQACPYQPPRPHPRARSSRLSPPPPPLLPLSLPRPPPPRPPPRQAGRRCRRRRPLPMTTARMRWRVCSSRWLRISCCVRCWSCLCCCCAWCSSLAGEQLGASVRQSQIEPYPLFAYCRLSTASLIGPAGSAVDIQSWAGHVADSLEVGVIRYCTCCCMESIEDITQQTKRPRAGRQLIDTHKHIKSKRN